MAGERLHQQDKGSFFGDFIYHRIVPQDHFLRQLDALLPWPRLTKRLVRLYRGKARQGRPPYHPAVILKTLLVAYLYDLSERQTQVVANDSLSIEWFLGLAVDEPAPDHSTLTRFKNRLVEGGKLEAALIDAYPGLTNIAAGAGASDFGVMHAREIIQLYSAKPAVFHHKALLISVNRSAAERSLYDATRYAWKISKARARQAEVILATMRGLIVGAFVAHDWLAATPENFPGLAVDGAAPGRFGFVGEEAPDDIKKLYVGRRVPDQYRKKGAANPIKYTWMR